MPAIHGKTGKVLWDTTTVDNVLSWSLDISADVEESSPMSAVAVTTTTHFKAYLPGFTDWTATVECDLEDSGIDPEVSDLTGATGASLELHTGSAAESGRKFSGTGFVIGVNPSVDKDGIVKITYTFQGSGAISEDAGV